MKKIDWGKVIKTAGIILAIVLVVLYFDQRDRKRQEKIDEQVTNMSFVSEELSALKRYCEDAVKYEGYEDLCISMYHVEEKCDELRDIIDDAYRYFSPKEDDYDGRRSWFY